MNGAEALLELFRIQGTDYIFCSPIAFGHRYGRTLVKRKATSQHRDPEILQLYATRFWRLASPLAITRPLGAHKPVLLPTGLGVLNGAMAVRSAYHEHMPMVIVAPDTLTHGAVPDSIRDRNGRPCWSICGPGAQGETVTKWGKEVKTPRDLAADIRRAWYFAESVPRGPTCSGCPSTS